MKKHLLLILGVICVSTYLSAQTFPQGMKYQAVARNQKGDVLADQPVTLRISLMSGPAGKQTVHYSEVHETTTNELGLFTLVVGEGKTESGTFSKVPWATEDIWMEIAIRDNAKSGFVSISNSRLLAVPYAFHALTASSLSNNNSLNSGNQELKNASGVNQTMSTTFSPSLSASTPGVPANVWSLQGNSSVNSATDRLGSTNAADLVIITNNTERMRITSAGNIQIKNDLEIGNNLTVKKNVWLNTTEGSTTNNGPFTVANMSATNLTGTLNVDKATTLNNTLDVTDVTHLKNNLITDGSTDLNGALNVNNMSPTLLTGTLTVNGKSRFKDSVQFDKAINISGVLSSSGLNVAGNNTNYLATFQNTNSSNGDGILIKLGRVHPRWNGSAYANVPNPGVQGLETQINQIRDWIYGNDTFSPDDLINLMPSQYLAGTICNLTNYITQQINNALNLPKTIGPYTLFGGLDLPDPLPDIPSIGFPQVTVMPQIPQLNCSGLPTLSWPVLQLTDVNNSLTKENEFISFADKDGRKLGAIRAQSIENFSYDYFDGVKLLNIAGQIVGIDIVKDLVSVIAGVSEMADAYNNIGVEYYSGNGDYAEWLERCDPNEPISFGDIVAVKAGKITKDLKNAEQIMAISKKPIVLGNVPDQSRIDMGNNVAFVGQIPVKVIGAVLAGDYIVAKGDVPGYGMAIHPKDMTIEDFKLVVGRSWDTNEKDGPKMVNTVVGIHNHDFLNIISQLQKKAETTDQRLQTIEKMLNIGTDSRKKAF
jgi:hypothetical protein